MPDLQEFLTVFLIGSLLVNCLYSIRPFSARPYACFLILWAVPLMTSYFSYKNTYCTRGQGYIKVYHRILGKRTGFDMSSHLHLCEGRHCLLMPIGMRRLFLSVYVYSEDEDALVCLWYFKSEDNLTLPFSDKCYIHTSTCVFEVNMIADLFSFKIHFHLFQKLYIWLKTICLYSCWSSYFKW